MHRKPLLRLLERYVDRFSEDAARIQPIRDLVVNQTDCFERTCFPGHITASTWIVDADRERFLLTHHRKLGRWLQLGGHADGDPDVQRTAVREAREESGLLDFEWGLLDGELLPLDVDVHRIPARRDEPEHDHHDIRFLLIAAPGQALQMSEESNDLRWFEWKVLDEVAAEESLHRLGRRALQLLPELRTVAVDPA